VACPAGPAFGFRRIRFRPLPSQSVLIHYSSRKEEKKREEGGRVGSTAALWITAYILPSCLLPPARLQRLAIRSRYFHAEFLERRKEGGGGGREGGKRQVRMQNEIANSARSVPVQNFWPMSAAVLALSITYSRRERGREEKERNDPRSGSPELACAIDFPPLIAPREIASRQSLWLGPERERGGKKGKNRDTACPSARAGGP